MPQIEQRVHESLRRGARVVLVPASARLSDACRPQRGEAGSDAQIVKVGTIQSALEFLTPSQRSLAVESKPQRASGQRPEPTTREPKGRPLEGGSGAVPR